MKEIFFTNKDILQENLGKELGSLYLYVKANIRDLEKMKDIMMKLNLKKEGRSQPGMS